MEKVRELFDYLQDPHLVARFQHLCGVRGIFTTGSCNTPEPTQAHQNGACLRHGSRGNRSENAGEAKPAAGAQRTDAEHTRLAQNGAPVPASATHGESTGTGTSGHVQYPPRGSTVKPLRKNSLTGDVGQEFVIENRFLFYLFTLGTELGNELFYIIFFPFIMWNIDVLVGRRLVMVWVWVMYLGQCTKDLLRWSRPASPPVVKVEMFYNSEYSMPSTHAMSGTAIPFSLFFMTDGRWEVSSNGPEPLHGAELHSVAALIRIGKEPLRNTRPCFKIIFSLLVCSWSLVCLNSFSAWRRVLVFRNIGRIESDSVQEIFRSSLTLMTTEDLNLYFFLKVKNCFGLVFMDYSVFCEVLVLFSSLAEMEIQRR